MGSQYSRFSKYFAEALPVSTDCYFKLLLTIVFVHREKGQYVSGRELKDLARTAGNDTM